MAISEIATNMAGGTTATAIATVGNGAVTALKLTNGGSGYASAPAVWISGGGGYGALAQATVTGGSVTALSLIMGGSNYTAAPDVNILLDGGSALLAYAIQTYPDPLTVPQHGELAKFNLIVSNQTTDIVYCDSISVTLPGPGINSTDLTTSFTGIGVEVGSENPDWNVTQNGGVFTLTPLNPKAGTITSQGLVFTFDNILVNRQVGICTVKIAELTASSSRPAGNRSAPSIALQKWPAGFGMLNFTALPIGVPYDGSTVLNWLVQGSGVTCHLLYDPTGSGTPQNILVPNSGQKTIDHLTNPLGVVFTLQARATIPGQSQPMIQQLQQTVSVGPPTPTIDFSIQANPLAPGEDLSFTLSWTVTHINNFQIIASDGPNGTSRTLPVPYSPKGSYVVEPLALHVTYTLQSLATLES